MKFKTFPAYLDDMGSIPSFIVRDSLMETKEENLLWQINSMRDHDGLPRLDLDDLDKLNITFTVIEQ